MNNISESAKRRSVNNVSSSVVSYAKCETINYYSSELRCNIFKTFRIDDHAIFSRTFFERIRTDSWVDSIVDRNTIN